MDCTGAVVFLPRDNADEKPLLLEDLLFSPCAVWLTEALKSMGAVRFLAVCHPDDQELALACFPPGTQWAATGAPDTGDRLSAFLAECRGNVAVVTRPVLLTGGAPELLPAGRAAEENVGLACISAKVLLEALSNGENFSAALGSRGQPVVGGVLPLRGGDPALWRSYQSRAHELEIHRLEALGARFIDPSSCFSDPTVTVGRGTVILPGTILRGRTTVGKNCRLGPYSVVRDCFLGDGVTVNASQLNESTVDENANIGPFAYLRPNCHVGAGVKVGDFVELKNSVVGDGTKISHLTYVGDSDVGSRVNIGCGTVTVNYDGAAKYRTVIGDGAFIGCNTNLVAPVKVGNGAYTAAGSTVTQEVPEDSLCIARCPQVIKVQWAARRRKARGKK